MHIKNVESADAGLIELSGNSILYLFPGPELVMDMPVRISPGRKTGNRPRGPRKYGRGPQVRLQEMKYPTGTFRISIQINGFRKSITGNGTPVITWIIFNLILFFFQVMEVFFFFFFNYLSV